MNRPANGNLEPASAAVGPVGPVGALDARAFRNALGQFPTGVCVVTARAPDGEDLGMTMSSFNSLSLDPPLVLFSIDRRSHRLDQWQEAKGYAINVLAESQRDVSGRFARPSCNKWAGIDFDRGEAGAPRFARRQRVLRMPSLRRPRRRRSRSVRRQGRPFSGIRRSRAVDLLQRQLRGLEADR